MPEALERGKRIKTILRTGQDTTGSGDVWPRAVGNERPGRGRVPEGRRAFP
jgi:hypothetical protein